jgi:hypothetical protein
MADSVRYVVMQLRHMVRYTQLNDQGVPGQLHRNYGNLIKPIIWRVAVSG